jgi:beta-lactamase class C
MEQFSGARKMNKWMMWFSLLSALLVSNSLIAEADDFSLKADTAFNPVIKQYDLPGLVVGVTKNGDHKFFTSGLASRADNRPVTPDTLFEIGSISKVFTVTLAALAEERGILNLKNLAAHYLCADACALGDNLTLMDLATHHSGGLPLNAPDNISDVNSVVNWLKGWHPPQPGTRSYSNVSIGILGYITGKAMGSNYAEAAQTVLFPAFGLNNTWIQVPQKQMGQYAFGYDKETNEPIRLESAVLDAEAYGLKSSARDMLKILDIELGRGQASDELRKAVKRTQEGQYKTALFTQDLIWEQYQWPASQQSMMSGNGFNFALKPQPVEKITPPLPPQKDVIINKTGSTKGFGGYIAFVPSKGIGIVVLANKNYPSEARVKATYSLIEALLLE